MEMEDSTATRVPPLKIKNELKREVSRTVTSTAFFIFSGEMSPACVTRMGPLRWIVSAPFS